MRTSGIGGARLLLLALLPALAGLMARGAGGEVVQAMGGAGAGTGGGAGAQFAGRQRTRVPAAAGGAAELRCAVRHLSDRVVSWVRTSDLQILAHAGVVFTGDARVSAAAARSAVLGSDEEMDELSEENSHVSEDSAGTSDVSVHTLRIERLRASDAGRYECQVNTEPKMSLMFELVVVDEEAPHIEVAPLGAGATVRGAPGGAATLACEARWRPAPRLLRPPPLRLRWLRDGRELEVVRGGVAVETSRGRARVVSRLTLAPLRARHAGRYSCEAAARGHAPRSHTLTLLVGDDSGSSAAEMQRDEAAPRAAGGAGWPRPQRALLPLLPLALLAMLPAAHLT